MRGGKIDFENILRVGEEEIIEKLLTLKERLERIIFLVGEIEDEKDREVVDVYLDMLTMAKEEADATIGYRDPVPLRKLVRDGAGDYKRIQQKCIQMGLV